MGRRWHGWWGNGPRPRMSSIRVPALLTQFVLCCTIRKRNHSNIGEDMDELDRKIVSILQQDGRASNAKIARQLGVSEGTIRRRLKKLIQDETIQVLALPDPAKMGFATQVPNSRATSCAAGRLGVSCVLDRSITPSSFSCKSRKFRFFVRPLNVSSSRPKQMPARGAQARSRLAHGHRVQRREAALTAVPDLIREHGATIAWSGRG